MTYAVCYRREMSCPIFQRWGSGGMWRGVAGWGGATLTTLVTSQCRCFSALASIWQTCFMFACWCCTCVELVFFFLFDSVCFNQQLLQPIHTNGRRCPSGSWCVCVLWVCQRVCVSESTSRGLWLMGSLLMLSQDYRWLRWLGTDLTSVLICTFRTHTPAHTYTLSFLSGSHRCTYAHKPPTSANKLTHPDIPLTVSLDLLAPLPVHTHTHTHP